MAGFKRFALSPSFSEHKTIISENGKNADGRGAFPTYSVVRFEVDAPVNTESASMLVLSDGSGEITEYPMIKDGKRFSLVLDLSTAENGGRGLYFYKYRFKTGTGDYEMRLREKDCSEEISYAADGFDGAFQLLIYARRENYPDFLRGAVMYQIFPDRFCRGANIPPREDAVIQNEGDTPIFADRGKKMLNNNFFRGDLYGVIEKLGYLKSLGVNVIYLNPIFKSYSNHRYDTGDYMHVDEMLGGDEALEALIAAADREGMHIILDGVFNHTGDDSVYFNKYGKYDSLGAYQSKDSPYFNWYNFKSFPNDYEAWWGIKILPRVRCDDSTYREFICGEGGVVRKYLRKGVAGWRLDVADELSDGFLAELKSAAVAEKKDAYVLGEVWEDATNKVSYGARRKYFHGDELDGVMNYPCRSAIINYLRGGDYTGLIRTLRRIYGNYPPECADFSMNTLGTHDTERILTALAGEDPTGKSRTELSTLKLTQDQRERGLKLLKMAYVMLCALPGVPCIYYGDEAEAEGYGDPFCRGFYPWGHENTELVDFFAKVGKTRRGEDIFKSGSIAVRFADSDIACFERIGDDDAIAVVVNRSEKTYEFVSRGAKELLSGDEGDVIAVAPMSAAMIKIKKDGDYTVFEKIDNPRER